MFFHGRSCTSQRFAVDWLRYDSAGKLFKGSGERNADFFGYGEPVLAVADGKVFDIRDGIPENEPAKAPTVSITDDTLNRVGLQVSATRYVYYAHLLPGSVRVKVGQRVKRGDVLAKLGNSGNSTAPHLHFEVVDGPSFLSAQGVPFAFKDAQLHEGTGSWIMGRPAGKARRASGTTVAENEVLSFP
jgi:murein DD-endopeptidase